MTDDLAKPRIEISRSASGRFVATSPDEIGLHVLADTEAEAMEKAKAMLAALRAVEDRG